MEGSRAGAGDYIASLLSSSPRLDFGVLGADGGGGEEEDCLDKFCGDPGFAARAARLSSFSGQRFPCAASLFGLSPPVPAASGGCGGEFAGSREASSVSDPASAMKDANAKKRKAPAAAKGKGKESSVQVRELCLCLNSNSNCCPGHLAPVPRLASLTPKFPCGHPGRGAEGSGRQEVQDGGGRGEPREAQVGAGRERQLRRGRRAEPEAAGQGEECEAGGAPQGLRPCPGQERAGY